MRKVRFKTATWAIVYVDNERTDTWKKCGSQWTPYIHITHVRPMRETYGKTFYGKDQ